MPLSLTKNKTSRPRTRRDHIQPQWTLRRASGLQILEAPPLKKLRWLIHGFSTRPGGVSVLPSPAPHAHQSRAENVLNLGLTAWDSRPNVDKNRVRLLAALGARKMQLVTLRQIHSDIVHVVSTPPQTVLQGDALITATPCLLLAIQTADCIPILLADPGHRAVAAIHAGWRGTLARIAAKTVGRMQMEFSTRPKDLIAVIGPGISQCCYQVGPDVVKNFAAKFSNARDWFEGPFDQLASGEGPNPLPWLTMMPPGHQPPPPRCMLDLKAANSAILAEAGLSAKNIFATDLCTSCRTDLFFSYRREKNTGRMLSVIGIL
ncbi:MAG TPA: peptidoglycan editing factor PgeF [Candidatus Acidoferrales bacterium]|nr:peptidoglycan editing factor PgeF [Candidatus Acidoferrales bacterium]